MEPTTDTTTNRMFQAVDTAKSYMLRGQEIIDAHFGKGYAAQHPELLAAFMQTAAMDFDTWVRRMLHEQKG